MGKAVWISIGVIALAGAGLGVVATRTDAVEKVRARLNPEPEPKLVRLDQVRRSDVTRSVSAPGLVEPRRNVEISAQVSARIVALPFEEGDRVRAGDVVVRLDAEDLTARLEAAKARLKAQEARLRGAEADLAVALSDFGRKRELLDSGDIAETVFEQSENRYNQAVATVEMAKADVEIARAEIIEAERDLSNSTITSPIDGVITTLDAEIGELVVVGTLNNPGSVILMIADLSDMLLRARVDESNVAQLEAGQEATVYVNAYRDRPFFGVVERVGLERRRWDDGTWYYETEIKMRDDPERALLSGLSATAEIAVQELRDVLVVPSQAVLDRRIDELPKETIDGAGGLIDPRKTFATVVYVIDGGKAKAVPVSVGPSDLSETVILGGLAEGDSIITGPFKTIVDLAEDAPVRDEAEAKAEEETQQEAEEEAAGAAATSDEQRDGAPDPDA